LRNDDPKIALLAFHTLVRGDDPAVEDSRGGNECCYNHSESFAADSLQIVKSERVESIYGCNGGRPEARAKRRTTLGAKSAIM
jgi:hypothetical protein